MSHDTPTIQVGDYIVIQRQKYTKLHKFGSLETTAMLGKEQLELRGICDNPYGATFKMCPKEGKQRRGPRLNTLELCHDNDSRGIREVLGISSSGSDNRNIVDNGASQSLRPEDIRQLREECFESTKIIEKIVENSKTFHKKTEYSQEKYLKKKEKKYCEYIQIHEPTIRLIAEIYYRQDFEKIMGLRMDTLSQMLCYSGVSAFGNYLMYESGTYGLLPASFMNAMGANTEAMLVHMHPGNMSQKQAILAMNFPPELTNRCISVNIYSVLRQYYQGPSTTSVSTGTSSSADSKTLGDTLKNNDESAVDLDTTEPCSKKPKLEQEDPITGANQNEASAKKTAEQPQKWKVQNERACALMRDQFNSLVIVAKEHPGNIVKALLPFVKPSSPVVVFSHYKELLMELYIQLKTSSEVTNLHLTSNWMRMYQILPNRTHPEVNMNGSSGYLLWGYVVR